MPIVQQRRGTAAELSLANETLAAGQIVYETDTNRMKVGDGVRTYSALPYLGSDIADVSGLQAALDTKGSVSDTNLALSRGAAAQATADQNAIDIAGKASKTQNNTYTGNQNFTSGVSFVPYAISLQALGYGGASLGDLLYWDGTTWGKFTPTYDADIAVVETTLNNLSTSFGSHSSRHATTGSDPIAPADIGAASDADLQAVSQVANTAALDAGSAVIAAGNALSAANTNASTIAALTPASIGAQPAGTYATLVNGTVPAAQLPSFVDDVIEAAGAVNFPATGDAGVIYVDTATDKAYRWSGSTYIEISASPGTTDDVAEGSLNLYHTNARVISAINGQAITPGDITTSGVFSTTNAIIATSGGVTSCGVQFQGDPDTGITRSSANVMNLVAGGANRITVNANGSILGGSVTLAGTVTVSNGLDPSQLAQGGAATNEFLQWDGSSWSGGTVSIADVSALQSSLDAKASLSGATFTGDVEMSGSQLLLNRQSKALAFSGDTNTGLDHVGTGQVAISCSNTDVATFRPTYISSNVKHNFYGGESHQGFGTLVTTDYCISLDTYLNNTSNNVNYVKADIRDYAGHSQPGSSVVGYLAQSANWHSSAQRAQVVGFKADNSLDNNGSFCCGFYSTVSSGGVGSRYQVYAAGDAPSVFAGQVGIGTSSSFLETLYVDGDVRITGAVTLDSGLDVGQLDQSGASANDVLTWDGTTWIAMAPSSGGGGSTNLGGLTDVALSSPSTGALLRYNGTQWEDADQSAINVTQFAGIQAGASNNHVLAWNGTAWASYSLGFLATIGQLSLTQISDVSPGSTTVGSVLTWNGSGWLGAQPQVQSNTAQAGGTSVNNIVVISQSAYNSLFPGPDPNTIYFIT